MASTATIHTLFPKIRVDVSRADVTLIIGGQTLGMAAELGAADGEHQDSESPSDRLTRWSTPDYTRREVKSVEVTALATTASRALQRILLGARDTRERVDHEIPIARQALVAATSTSEAWKRGFVLKYIRKKKFQELESRVQQAEAVADELYDRRRRAIVIAEFVVQEPVATAFDTVREAFRSVAASAKVWDTLSVARTNQVAERTSASESIERRLVTFSVRASDMMFCDWHVPRLANANGGDLYIYPGFILYAASAASFAVIDTREVQLTAAPSQS